MPIDDITGQRFARLTAVRYIGLRERGHTWLFRCDCGNEREVAGSIVKSGALKSCGCLGKEIAKAPFKTHGHTANHSASKTYSVWLRTKARCHQRAHPQFRLYGGKGIEMHQAWRDDFAAFHADMGDCPEGHTLKRIDESGHYSPGNVRWTPFKGKAKA